MTESTPAIDAATASGIAYEVVRTRPAGSAEESAALQEIPLRALLRTLVVRRAADDYLFVLVPGGRRFDWPKLRAHLGVRRMTMPDAEEAREVTGYERGAITPFGAARPLARDRGRRRPRAGRWWRSVAARAESTSISRRVTSSRPSARTSWTSRPMSEPLRRTNGDTLVSTATPAMRMQIDAAMPFLGSTEIVIKGIAHAERHYFVEARDGQVRRMLVAQFEGFLSDNATYV